MAKKHFRHLHRKPEPKYKPCTVREGKGFMFKIFPSGNKTPLYIYDMNKKRKQLNSGDANES